MKLFYEMMSLFWLTAPLWYLILRIKGIVNHPNDTIIYICLCIASWFVSFLNYRDDEEDQDTV